MRSSIDTHEFKRHLIARGPALSQPDAAGRSEKVEGAVVGHLAQGLVIRDPHHHALTETAEAGGEPPESLCGELLELRE
jgi:hypothetical protein